MKYFDKLIQQLQWSINESWSLGDFYFINETLPLQKKKEYLIQTSEFIYRCLSVGLLALETPLKEDLIYTLDNLKKVMLSTEDNELDHIKDWNFTSELNEYVWLAVTVIGSSTLEKLSRKLMLDQYDDFSMMNGNKQMFKNNIITLLNIKLIE